MIKKTKTTKTKAAAPAKVTKTKALKPATLATAKAAAIDAVIIPSGYGRSADAATQGAYHEIARFADLPGILATLDKD